MRHTRAAPVRTPDAAGARSKQPSPPAQTVAAVDLVTAAGDLGRVVELQRVHGNQAVQRLLAAPPNTVQRLGKPMLMQGSTRPEVKELQQKINQIKVTGDDGVPIKLAEDGIYGPKTFAAVKKFQASRNVAADGIVGPVTGNAIDQAVNNPITSEVKAWSENVGGVTYAMTSRYDWQITDTQIHITVRLKFTGDNAPKTTARWCDAIKNIWNKFDATDAAAGKKKQIYFDVQSVQSGEHNVVQVINGTGRSNAGQWYTQDSGGVGMNNTVAAHEFGHMVALADEYQLSHGDFKTTTGQDAPKGEEAGDAPAADIAAEIHGTMREAADKRVASTQGVVTNHGLKQGDFARSVVKAYKDAYNADLVADLVSHIPAADHWSIIDPFTHSGGGIMGDFYSKGKNAAGHDHPLAPRHMKTFVAYIQAAEGGNWTAVAR